MISALSDIRFRDAHEQPATDNRADTAIWLLVSGAPRSGTTLMAQILNTHPKIGCLHEYGLERVVDNVANFFGVDPNAHFGFEGETADFAEVTSFDRFSNERDRFVKKHAGSVFLYPRLSQHSDALRKSFFEVVSGKKDLRVLADKTPNKQDLRLLDQLRGRLGNLKHLYIVRHPIAVIASSMRRARGTELGTDSWHIKTIFEALAEWLDNWEYVSRSLVYGAEDVLLLRYEDLFVDFDLEMKKLALFLDVEPQFANICKQTPDKLVDFHLTRHQVAELEKHLGEIVMAWGQSAIVDTLVRFPRIFCVIDADREFVIGGNPLARLVLRQGFGAIEAWGAWTHGHKAEIRFKIEGLRKDAELYVELGFNPLMAGREYFEFIVRINGAPAEVRRLRLPPNQHAIRTGFLCKPLDGNVSIELFIANPKTIDEAPAGDHRPMGMGLTSIKPSLL